MTKALTGVRILDFTHVQSGPTCTQLLAWFGADVIKVERPGVGDITRGQLRDKPNVDSLYFTMLNHNKRSITLDTKNPKGKEVLTELIKKCDVLVENFGPGVLDRMGFGWEKIQSINPKMIVASIKGFGPGPYEDCKVYENVAQCTGGSASTTGFRDGFPLVTGAPGWKTHPDYAKPPARLPRLNEIFSRIEQWTMTKTKFEAMEILNKDDIPCGPILSMKELAEDQSLRATGTVVEVDHPERGKYFSVGNPIKMSDSPTEVMRSPLLGEHTDEILRQVLGFTDHQVAQIHDSGALDPPRKVAAE